MAWVMAAAQFAGYGSSAIGAIEEGAAARREGQINANTLEMNAGQTKAYAQRRAIQERRQARLVQSRAKVVMAKGGGSLDDPTARKITTDLDTEGEMRAMLELYQGDEEARGMRAQADAARRGGADAQKAANYRATATILEGASSLYDKYGGSKKSTTKTAGYG